MAKAQTAARSPGRDTALKIAYLNATAGGGQFQIVLARHREAEQGRASLRKAEEVEQAGIFFAAPDGRGTRPQYSRLGTSLSVLYFKWNTARQLQPNITGRLFHVRSARRSSIFSDHACARRPSRCLGTLRSLQGHGPRRLGRGERSSLPERHGGHARRLASHPDVGTQTSLAPRGL